MSPFELVVLGLLLPAAIAAGGLLVFGWLARRTGKLWLRAVGSAIGLGAGFFTAQVAIQGWQGFPPAETTRWLGPLALIGALWGIIQQALPWPRVERWGLRLALSVGLFWLMKPMAHPAIIVLGIWAWWGAAEGLAARSAERAFFLVFGIASAALGASLLFSFSLIHARLGGALAAALAGAWLASLVLPKSERKPGGVPVIAAVYLGLLMDGHFYSELPLASALLLSISPLGLWISRLDLLQRGPKWRRGLAVVLAVGFPLVVGVGIALKGWLATKDEYNPEELGHTPPTGSPVVLIETRAVGPGYCL